MASILGVTLAKINGIYNVNVVNATWDVAKDLPSVKTGGGVKNAKGLAAMSGGFDEVYPADGTILDLTTLDAFSIQIYDQPTQKVLVMSAQRCDWDKADGSSAVEGANTRRKWSWKAEAFTKF